MTTVTKIEAVQLFQQFNLESLPARVYPAGRRPSANDLARDFPGTPLFMLRTGSDVEERNLPRQAGVSLAEAGQWIGQLSPSLHLVVQPYASVVYSVELAVWGDDYLAELVPGIWELSTDLRPVVLTRWRGALAMRGPVTSQPAAFYLPKQGPYTALATVADWQVQALVAWIASRRDGLLGLQRRLGNGLGIKLHDAVGYGLSPQNIRTNLPPFEPERIATMPTSLVGVRSVNGPIPNGSDILLDVSVAREHHGTLTNLIHRLQAANVGVVYLKSGLLSHLAIALREAGLTVRRST